ncbi:uncharacterized protein LOC119421625 [Nematolebias whitei]|uniref:uncharacterized protein LOC119421625 n=1 Tax=Nematolebias whitei TaxID=451745 RepID=UPI0018971602|nr:uncharacterized protein LOC119421625 [Nematolebias whitei]
MAAGFILWVSYMVLLLGDGVLSTVREGDFRVSLDNKNLKTGDSNSIFSYQGEKDWADKFAGLLPPNYIQPSVAQLPNLIPARQTPGNAPSGEEVEKIVNGEAREWESNLLEPIRFPLIASYPKVGPERQRPTLNQPQSAPLPTFLVKKPAVPSLVESSFENKNLMAKPALYVAASSPSFQSPPASPVVKESPFGSLNQLLYTVSSPGGKPVFERPQEKFEEPLSSGSNVMGFGGTRPKYNPVLEQESHEYPSVYVKPQSSPPLRNAERYSQGNGIDGSIGYALPLWKPSFLGPVGGLSYRDWMGFPFSGFGNDNLYYGQMAFKPQNFMTNTQNYWVPQLHFPQRVIRPSSRHPRRKSYVRSKSGYQRRRFLQSKTTYIPGFGKPQKYTPKSETQKKYPLSLTPFRKPAQNSRLLVREPITSWKL